MKMYEFNVVKDGRVIKQEKMASLDKLDSLKNEWYAEEDGDELEEMSDAYGDFRGYTVYMGVSV